MKREHMRRSMQCKGGPKPCQATPAEQNRTAPQSMGSEKLPQGPKMDVRVRHWNR